MKKLLLAIALISTTITAQATDYSYCVAVGQLARSTMDIRQAGVSMSDALGVSDDDKITGMILDAYSRHRFLTEQYRMESTVDFAIEYYAKCLDGDY